MDADLSRAIMTVTLTIKQVPERLAQKLRERAAASHRSLQGELMSILHEALSDPVRVMEPEARPYSVKRQARTKSVPVHGRRLTLRELWERSRRLGPKSKSESAAIVRELRDERYRR
jgi:plasmid stability protein